MVAYSERSPGDSQALFVTAKLNPAANLSSEHNGSHLGIMWMAVIPDALAIYPRHGVLLGWTFISPPEISIEDWDLRSGPNQSLSGIQFLRRRITPSIIVGKAVRLPIRRTKPHYQLQDLTNSCGELYG